MEAIERSLRELLFGIINYQKGLNGSKTGGNLFITRTCTHYYSQIDLTFMMDFLSIIRWIMDYKLDYLIKYLF